MRVLDSVKEIEVEVKDDLIVYVHRRDKDNPVPYTKDFDKIKIKDAVKGERVQTFLYSKGKDVMPEIYKIIN